MAVHGAGDSVVLPRPACPMARERAQAVDGISWGDVERMEEEASTWRAPLEASIAVVCRRDQLFKDG